jgi:hypothetical protein
MYLYIESKLSLVKRKGQSEKAPQLGPDAESSTCGGPALTVLPLCSLWDSATALNLRRGRRRRLSLGFYPPPKLSARRRRRLLPQP